MRMSCKNKKEVVRVEESSISGWFIAWYQYVDNPGVLWGHGVDAQDELDAYMQATEKINTPLGDFNG